MKAAVSEENGDDHGLLAEQCLEALNPHYVRGVLWGILGNRKLKKGSKDFNAARDAIASSLDCDIGDMIYALRESLRNRWRYYLGGAAQQERAFYDVAEEWEKSDLNRHKVIDDDLVIDCKLRDVDVDDDNGQLSEGTKSKNGANTLNTRDTKRMEILCESAAKNALLLSRIPEEVLSKELQGQLSGKLKDAYVRLNKKNETDQGLRHCRREDLLDILNEEIAGKGKSRLSERKKKSLYGFMGLQRTVVCAAPKDKKRAMPTEKMQELEELLVDQFILITQKDDSSDAETKDKILTMLSQRKDKRLSVSVEVIVTLLTKILIKNKNRHKHKNDRQITNVSTYLRNLGRLKMQEFKLRYDFEQKRKKRPN